MGSEGARFFVPPYIDPIEQNVDPQLIAALNQLGSYMAAEMMSEGKTGIVVNAIFDAFTPARAYQHYHGGVRILTETASARMATPINVRPEDLREGRGYHAGQPSWNFPAPWQGGEWRLADIVDYMDSGAMALLTNAARNRRFWLENFHSVNRRATERWPQWPHAWVIPAGQANQKGLDAVLRILRMGDVEVHQAQGAFTAGGRQFARGSYVIPMNQPFASFAQTMLERQQYPDLREYPGGPPQRPYDVTAHTLPLLMNVEAVAVDEPVSVGLSAPIPTPQVRYTAPRGLTGRGAPRIAIYKSWVEPMPQGWTRWTLDQHGIAYDTLHDADIRRGDLARRYDVLLMQDQPGQQIVAGWPDSVMPDPYAGGLGEQGVEAIRQFVQNGGRLVAIERATDFAAQTFDLGVRNAVADLRPQEFYIPGSILALQLDAGHPLARGVDPQTIAWYWGSSRAFEVNDPSVRVAARYRTEDPVLSGWALGEERIAGNPAIVEARIGRGSVVLFGFQPDYRAQTIATWPLLFNALMPGRVGGR
ncbi:MAG TPA: M14 family metallopeptidase, partial [Longimicrobiaceae bacterium]|nr:M14 family metallopeptidase [Longimicrobiaceae bacterium]